MANANISETVTRSQFKDRISARDRLLIAEPKNPVTEYCSILKRKLKIYSVNLSRSKTTRIVPA